MPDISSDIAFASVTGQAERVGDGVGDMGDARQRDLGYGRRCMVPVDGIVPVTIAVLTVVSAASKARVETLYDR